MTTVGEILANARNAKKLTPAQVEAATKIRAKFITALENNQFDKLPPGTFTKGFIKNYASFLGLPKEEVLAFYRRQVDEDKIAVLPAGRANELVRRFILTPQRFVALATALFLAAFFAYLAFSYFQFAGAPTLAVDQPKNNSVTSFEAVDVVGKTDPAATLTINGQAVSTHEDGSFRVKVDLTAGINTITVTATNKYRRQTTIVRNLRLEQ